MRDIFIVFDLEGRFLLWNDSARLVSGYTDDEISKMSPADFFRGEDVAKVAETINRGLEEGFASVEAGFCTKDGSVLDYEFYGTPILDDGGAAIGVTAIGRDITDRLLLREKEKQAATAQATAREAESHAAELMAIIEASSGELRRPVATLMRCLNDLVDYSATSGDEELKGPVGDLEDAAGRLVRIVNTLSDVSRIDREGVVLHYKEAEPEKLIMRAIAEVRAIGAASSIDTSVPAESFAVRADPERVKDVLRILLNNAVIHGPREGGIEVGYRKGRDLVSFFVADRGPGIPPEERQKVFERFYRVESGEAGSSQGLGLGLYIARRYVEAHGGSIAVEPREGGGSVFTFVLPDDQTV